MASLVVWFIAVQLAALAALPLTFRVFRSLPDRGYGLSKPLGLLLVGYLAWLTSMLGFTAFLGATTILLAAALGGLCWATWGGECRAAIRERRRLLIAFELIFLGALTLGIVVRAYNPDIFGQEKFMDYAIMNAFLRAGDLPAEDPWLAGFGVPYYHLGYLVLGLPGKIGGLPGPVIYNLAVAYVFAVGLAGAASIVYALLAGAPTPESPIDRTALGFALLGGAMAVVLGNFEAPLELLAAAGWGDQSFWQTVGVKNLTAAPSDGLLPAEGGWWWRASRVIPNIQPDGITEFPYFSFLLGDLHPHYTAIPWDLLVVGLALAAWLDPADRPPLATTIVTAVVLGALVAANTWDVATFWVLLFAAYAADVWRRGYTGRRWIGELANRATPFLLAPIAIAPYFVGYQSQRLGLGVVDERTPLVSMLILFGPALAVALAFAAWMIVGSGRHAAGMAPAPGALAPRALALCALIVVGLLALGEPTLALLGLLAVALAWAGWLWLRSASRLVARAATPTLFLWLLAASGVTILIGVEIFYLRDTFGTRMNTVFKFHYNAWLLLAIAGAGALGALWTSRPDAKAPSGWRLAGVALLLLVVVPGAVYPLAATWTKSGGFRGEATLEGDRFLRRSKPSDYEAIRWLQANAAGRPVVVEAIGPDYQEFARVSTFSGLPTLVGWIGHELQWRGDRPEYGRRQRDVDAIYRAATREEALARAEPYGARYLFFGSLERERYGAETQQRLNQLLPVAFARGTTAIYLLSEGAPERAR
jgi:YYY domain-containing protein